LLQSYEDEFGVEKDRPTHTPAETGKVLVEFPEGTELSSGEQTKYWQGMGKLPHMMLWSRPEIYNAIRLLSRLITLGASGAPVKAMHIIMEYCVDTEKWVLTLEQDNKFNGDPDFKLLILGRADSDSDFAKDPDSRKIVSGNITFLGVAPVVQISSMHKIVALSVMEAELFATTSSAQDMIESGTSDDPQDGQKGSGGFSEKNQCWRKDTSH
jgi:hypothetical protein